MKFVWIALLLAACHGSNKDTTPKNDSSLDAKSGNLAEVERDTNFDGKFDVKELYDSSGQLVSIQRDRNGDGRPDAWEQYQGGVLIAMLWDDDFDGKVDRKEEIPGAHPKVE